MVRKITVETRVYCLTLSLPLPGPAQHRCLDRIVNLNLSLCEMYSFLTHTHVQNGESLVGLSVAYRCTFTGARIERRYGRVLCNITGTT